MDAGKLVPDELVCDLVADRIAQDDCVNGYVLDGFPRTIPQAEALDAAVAKMGQKMDYALDIDVPDEAIISRMSGRRACVGCGATYHVVFNPPKVEGVCDKCGGELEQRKDDNVETAENRIVVYNESTAPLIGYYSETGALKNFDAEKDPAVVFEEIVKEIGE